MSPFKPFDVRARIVGGEIADVKNWPWAARVWINGRYMRESSRYIPSMMMLMLQLIKFR